MKKSHKLIQPKLQNIYFGQILY